MSHRYQKTSFHQITVLDNVNKNAVGVERDERKPENTADVIPLLKMHNNRVMRSSGCEMKMVSHPGIFSDQQEVPEQQLLQIVIMLYLIPHLSLALQ